MEWQEGRAGQARRGGQGKTPHPYPALPIRFLTRGVREHLISGELAFEHPHSKGLRFLHREKGVSGSSVGWVCPWLSSSRARATYRLGPVFPGRSLRRERIGLLHSRLGKGMVSEAGEGDSKVPRKAKGKSWVPGEGASATFPLVSSSGHPGLPFPLLSAPGRSAGDWDQEGDPCRRRGGGSRGGFPLSYPRRWPSLTWAAPLA